MGSEEPPSLVKALLRQLGLHPRKRLGQNFLVDREVLQKIVTAADLQPSDAVVEVGPGLGVLTEELARRVAVLVAVELDRGLAAALERMLDRYPSVKVVNADVLHFDPAQYLKGQPYKVVANLPYYVTSPVLRHFLEAALKPSLMVVMVQREVAQRIVAVPGEMSLLSVSVQFYGKPTLVTYVPAAAFYPRPKVESAVVRIDVYERPAVDVDSDKFFRVVQAGFSQPRKMLHNALAQRVWLPPGGAIEVLRAAGIDEKRRAQTLTLDEWGALTRELETRGFA
ncbi:MAG: 16S rRNA (adenine(1518)-N(6)/adenine(1519)-N(6))-dimethyltransferase RsmA [Chloroflexi bacterium]|nr:16S rRNA (adenine(1518)-N(6)/adenine(1519)-N(6))-dimethyltransferase RsmA [Chloroflexota bacterium]